MRKVKEKNVKVCSFYLEPGARRSFDEIANMTEVKSEALSPTHQNKKLLEWCINETGGGWLDS